MFGSACIESGVVVSRSFPGMFWQPGYRVLDPHDSACTCGWIVSRPNAGAYD